MKMNRSIPASIAVGGVLFFASCGGKSPSGPSVPAPGASPVAPAPTPKPAPAPTPDPRTGLAEGPVFRYTIKVRTVNNGEREVEQDNQGRYLVSPGERLDFDSTQKNAGGDICKWVNDPIWLINGRDMAFESSNGVVYRRGSSQPFLLKLTLQGTGTFTVQASLDGNISNILEVKSR